MDFSLSILICSLRSREKSLNSLLENLEKQKTSEIEIITDIDNGEITVGAKRQRLLERASGLFVAFIDDDDLVSSQYCSEIRKSILGHPRGLPDCCGMQGLWHIGKETKYIFWGLQYDWERIGKRYYIGTNHITPVRREIALQAGFPDISSGEDQEYGRRVRKIAKVESKIDTPLYFYMCDPSHKAILDAKKKHGR